MRIAFVGLGLIGGSVALALRADRGRDPFTLVAWTPGGRGPRAAHAAGAIDEVAPDLSSAVRSADLVVIAAPPVATLDVLDALASLPRDVLARGATVTDVASTKGRIVARAGALGLRFVGGHPMAGREAAGFGAGSPDLFAGRPWVVVPTALAVPADVARVEDLARTCGARPVRMDADMHDALAAAISHAPLVAAAALVEAVAGPPGSGMADDWQAARRLASTGWRDATRLARGDPAMGAGILVTNAPAVAARLRALAARIDAWIADLEAPGGPDVERIEDRLAADRARALEAPVESLVGDDAGPEADVSAAPAHPR